MSWITKPLKTNILGTGLQVLSHRRFLRTIARRLDQGQPVPLCLVKSDINDTLKLGKKSAFINNHQVLAIGYKLHARTDAKAEWDIYIYDPNHPNRIDVLHTGVRDQTVKNGTVKIAGFRAFFNTHYTARVPPWIKSKASNRELLRKLRKHTLTVDEDSDDE